MNPTNDCQWNNITNRSLILLPGSSRLNQSFKGFECTKASRNGTEQLVVGEVDMQKTFITRDGISNRNSDLQRRYREIKLVILNVSKEL